MKGAELSQSWVTCTLRAHDNPAWLFAEKTAHRIKTQLIPQKNEFKK